MTANGASQRGFGLIDIMIGLVLSLVILLGMIQLLQTLRLSYRITRAHAQVEQNSRLIRLVLTRAIEPAGHVAEPDTSVSATFPNGFISSQGQLQPDNYAAHSDHLIIRFQSDGHMSNCLGHTVPRGHTARYELYVDTEHELQCAVYTDAGQLKNVPKPLVSGVALMKVLYGLAGQHQPTAGIVAFTSSLAPADRWRVRSVHVQLILAGAADTRRQPPDTADAFTLIGAADSHYTPAMLYGDSGRRRLYKQTDVVIALRNRLP